MPEVGQRAPTFSLPSTSGRSVSLDELRGRKVVLYFYPRDDTPGCTQEACDFRDNLARVRGAGAALFGVSKDSLASHARFRGKHALPFELLSDEQNVVAKAYSAYGKKNMYGKQVEGTIRSTFLIDENGRIVRIWSPVKVAGHVDQVLAALHGGAVHADHLPGLRGARSRQTTSAQAKAREQPPHRKAKKPVFVAPSTALKPPRKPQAKSQPKSTAKSPAKKVAHRSRRKATLRNPARGL